MYRLFVISLFLLLGIHAFNQTGSEFWFAAPDVSRLHNNNSVPLNLNITAVHATQVTISRPADPAFVPLIYNLADQQSQIVVINSILTNIADIEVTPLPITDAAFLQDKGFLIETDGGDITAYYELDGTLNRDIFALKSTNALGTDFWVSTQRAFPNAAAAQGMNDCYSGFVVVATEPGTTVTIYPNGNDLEYFGIVPQIDIPVMAAGQTFSIRARNTAANQHIQGIKVVSDHPVTIMVYDDSMLKRINAGGSLAWDIFGDQLVPTDLVGYDYISMKGNTYQSAVDGGERLCFTATQNNTDIWINGILRGNIAAAGGYFEWGGVGKAINTQATFIHCTKPTYVNHIAGTGDQPSAVGGELGGAILPTVDGCTGSNSVTIRRSNAPLQDNYIVNLMVRVDPFDKLACVNNFTLTVGGITQPIPAAYFSFSSDSSYAFYNRTLSAAAQNFFVINIPATSVARIDNPEARFHLGVMHGGTSNGCKYGYFSDYADNGALAGVGGATAGNRAVYCSMDPIRLVAQGGKSYAWYCYSHPALTARISDTTIADPFFYPDASGLIEFRVIVEGECFIRDTLPLFIHIINRPNADFTLSEEEGCSPFTPILTNVSDTVSGGSEEWVFETTLGNFMLDQEDTTRAFPYAFPINNTDTVQQHRIRLIVKGPSFSCASEKYKDVKVKPLITSDFSVDDSVGCHPLLVNFINLASGHMDSTSFFWDFGDYSQSFDSIPSKIYSNYSLDDTTYIATLITQSPLGCTDTSQMPITVHPFVRAVMAVSASASCSPLNIVLDPENSIGVDTFIWNVISPDALGTGIVDTSYFTTINMPVSIYHYDSSYAGPDTIYVNLVGMNQMGCTDTFQQRNIVVFPEVVSHFDITNDSICDADSILFTNQSAGYNLFYNWDFDNGTVLQDTTDADYMQTFYNRSDADSSYRVTLEATSGYFCQSMFDTIIVVHPYIKANFGMDYENNCTPILTTFSNLSIRGHGFEWDFGDDSTSIITDSVFTHQYWNNSSMSDTTYIIRLIARNNEGCSDSITRSIDIFPHVVAAFDQSDSIGCSPLTVSLINNSSGGILSYLWDFGNGTSSTNPAPIPRNYTNFNSYDTTYFVSLTAINPYGCDSIMSDSVTVFAYVDADFNLPRADSCSPFDISPDNLSSAGAHIFDWDLLGTAFPTDHNFEPVFPTLTNTTLVEDTIDVRLITYSVNDPPHRACADTHSVQVIVYPELDVDFTLGTLASCQPLISTISNNTNLPSGINYQWYIDNIFYTSARDPLPLNIQNLESFDVNHTIRLSGESNHGCRDTALQNITIYSLVDSRFTINKSGICSSDSFEIDRSTSRGGITGYEWNFAGIIDNRTDSVFGYSFQNTASPTPLSEQIVLTVNNAHACTDTSRRNISVYPEVRADFAIDDSTVCYPYSTGFDNSTANANNYYWEFGDGTGSNDMIPDNHVFANFNNTTNESFTIQLIARSQYNCYDSLQHNLTVYAKPDAEFYFPVTVDCPPFEASMVSESNGFNLTYFWDFGDGVTSILPDPNHIFINGSDTLQDIPVTLIITSGMGCADTIVRELSVYPDVSVDFTASLTEGCSPLTVSFNGSAPNASNLIWYIDGQAFSTLEDPTYRFNNNTPDTRTYEVEFTGHSLFGCNDDTTQNITVYSSPSAEFIPEPLIQDYNVSEDRTTVTFNNETYFQDNWEYFWDFGDGSTGSHNDAVFDHIYGFEFWGTAAGNYKIPVYMVAWNNERIECRDTVLGEVYIKPPLPHIALEEDISGCEPFTVDFAATTRYVYEDSIVWDFGVDGATSTEDEPSYTYTEDGTYTVKLIVRGDGGTNWDYRIITVNPKPEIDFTFNDSVVFVQSQNRPDEAISFYNHTRYGENYWWFFEETSENGEIPVVETGNAQSIDEEPTWAYEEPGSYYVVLMASSGEACWDTMMHPVAIHVLGEDSLSFPTGFFVDPSAPRDEYVSDPRDTDRNIFRAYGFGVAEFHMEIYNRWGVLVFESNDINHGWNGFIDGEPAKQDVYLWRAKGMFTTGEPFTMSGDVTLITDPQLGQMK